MGNIPRGQPYSLDISRIELLYGIPVAPARGRALYLSIDGTTILRQGIWPGELKVLDVSGTSGDPTIGASGDAFPVLPFRSGDIDIVVLHKTLDHLAAMARRQGRGFVAHDFLSKVFRILSPGGLVIGCVENRYSIDHILHRAIRIRDTSCAVDSLRPFSVLTCHRALAAAEFQEISLFSMLPSPDAPHKLHGIHLGWSRHACLRQVEALRPLVGRASYLMWRILAELRISQYLGPAIFFWGRKKC